MSKKRILIVDDSIDMQHLLTEIFEAQGHSVQITSNGQIALELLNSSDDLPDVILLDLRMPVMDGYTFLQLKRTSLRLKDIPVVLMSGDDKIQPEVYTSPNLVLPKPLSISRLMEVVCGRTAWV